MTTKTMGRRKFLSLSSSALVLAASQPLAARKSANVSSFNPRPNDSDAEVFAAAHVIRKAREQGIGQELPF